MDAQKQVLFDQIESAFHGVELGDGVSLRETRVIDNYGTEEERRLAHESDETHDWHKLIDDPDLCRNLSIGMGGFHFLDAKGIRFHMPACLYLVVKDHENHATANMLECLFNLFSGKKSYNLGWLSIFNDQQRTCIRNVLIYLNSLDYYCNSMMRDAMSQFADLSQEN